MNIKPLSDRVVLQGLQNKTQTESGIFIPDSAKKEKPFIYTVVAVGPGKQGEEMQLNVGQQVLCGQYAGDEVKYEGKDYKIVGQDYILAIIGN
ncbi:MAG: co-chaperone GroES [Candidatus Gracilibacteria bacterium]|nr:co-chaperone GroES [Candidatus Gracilibacteria bacterium]